MRVPRQLKEGDRVRVVAPCGPFDVKRFERGLLWLRSIGIDPFYEPGVFERRGYLAGEDQRRLAELNAALDDDEAAAVWIARGGYGAMRLLPGLQVERVRRACKWLVGFSDVTALHATWQRAGVASVHAANVTTLGGWQPEALTALKNLLFSGRTPPLTGLRVSGSGSVTGPLIGGNIALLASLVGTRYLPSFQGALVLLEDVRERPYQLDRMLTQMLYARVFDGAVGIVVGQLTRCDDAQSAIDPCRGLDVVCERLETLGIPMLADLPVGHDDDACPVPLGTAATLDYGAGELRFTVADTVSPRPRSDICRTSLHR